MRKKIGNFFMNLWSFAVGGCYGFFGEGNEQWYYTLSLGISNILAWMYLPEVALVFTILSVIHWITIFLYGYFDWMSSVKYSFVYLIAHAIIAIVGLCTNWWWTLLSSAIAILAVIIAPDCCGESIIFRIIYNKFKYECKINDIYILLSHTLILAIYIIVTCMIPTQLWVKVIMILAALVLHPIIDLFCCESVIITDCTNEAFDAILHGDIYTRLVNQMEEMEKVRKQEEKNDYNNE